MNDNKNLKIFALGGQDERGKNLHCIEIDNSIFIFDVGSNHPSKKLSPGIDFVIPSFDYLKENIKRIKGIFITKLNENSCGGLKYILGIINVPVYSSELSIYILNKIIKRKVKYFALKDREVVKFKDVKIEAFSTTTCFPNSFGYALHSSLGTIIYTGDYIFDTDANTPFNTDISHIVSIAKRSDVLLLMADSSSASRIGYTAPNHKAGKYIKNELSIAQGRIILVCFNEDIYRIVELLSTIDVKEYEIGVEDDILINTFKFLILNSNFPIKDPSKIKNINDVKNIMKSIVIVSGTRETLYSKIIRITVGGYSKLQIEESDTIILATPPNPGSELNFASVLDELSRTLAKVITLSDRKVWNMNASSEDIKLMVNIIKPKYFMPVRSLYKDFIKANEVAIVAGVNPENTIIINNGDLVTFTKSKFKIESGKITTGNVSLNNASNEDVGSIVLSERTRLSTDGVLVVGATISKTTKLSVSTIDTQMRGVLYIKDFAAVSKKIQDIVEGKIKEYQKKYQVNNKYDSKELIKEIKSSLYIYMRKEIGKMPIILIVINKI